MRLILRVLLLLSVSLLQEAGQSRYKYLGKAAGPAVERARNYQVFQRGMAQLGRIHREVIDLLWKMGETKMKGGDGEK